MSSGRWSLLASVPFFDRHSYLRAIEAGIFERYARGNCGVCGGCLGPAGWGRRTFLDLDLRRAPLSSLREKVHAPSVLRRTGEVVRLSGDHRGHSFRRITRARIGHRGVAVLGRSANPPDRLWRTGGPARSTIHRWSLGPIDDGQEVWLSRGIAEIHRASPDHPITSRLPSRQGASGSPEKV